MKKILLLTLLLFGVTKGVFAEAKIDTLYYTKDWRKAPAKVLANFYRVTYSPTDTSVAKQYRDYYISGELQGAGYFINIDALDNAKSTFDGECISYFKSGKQAEVRHYKNGVLDGLYTAYSEDGSIKASGVYANGALSGLYTEFFKEGEFTQTDYADGKPKFDYYIKGDDHGNLMKFRISDNQPVWESPKVAERYTEYKDGTLWQIYNKNGVTIALTNASVKDYGKWHRIDMVISNNTIAPIEFEPSVNITASSVNAKLEVSDLKVWSAEEYLQKVNRTQVFATIMMGIAEGLATSNAGHSVHATHTHHAGVTYGPGGHPSGSYSGHSTSVTRVYDAYAAFNSTMFAARRMANFIDALDRDKEAHKLDYLKRNTLNPGDVISGYAHVKRVKGEKVQFVVNISGAEYVFNWDFGKKKKSKK